MNFEFHLLLLTDYEFHVLTCESRMHLALFQRELAHFNAIVGD